MRNFCGNPIFLCFELLFHDHHLLSTVRVEIAILVLLNHILKLFSSVLGLLLQKMDFG